MALQIKGKYKYKNVNGKETPFHRFIMHSVDPRPNEDELDVHHIDGNKANNDPSNLMWITRSEHARLHRLGDNHFPCSGKDNANYRHGMCVGGKSKEYVQYHNHKNYVKYRAQRLEKQNEYAIEHRNHKRWYDKVQYWRKQLETAQTREREDECLRQIKDLEENPV